MKRKAAILLSSWMDEEDEKIEKSLSGDVLDTGHAIWLYYRQSLSEDSDDAVREVFGLILGESGEVLKAVMKRPDHGTEMQFIPGESTRAMLPTPAGTIEATLKTRFVNGSRLDSGASLYMEYELFLQNELLGKRNLQLTCQWTGGGESW